MDDKPEPIWIVAAAAHVTKQVLLLQREHKWKPMYRQWMIAKQHLPQDNVKRKFAAPVPKNRIVICANKWLAPGMAQSNDLERGGTDKVKSGPGWQRLRIVMKP